MMLQILKRLASLNGASGRDEGNEDNERTISEVKRLSDFTWSNRQPDTPKDASENNQLLHEGLFFSER